MTERSDQPTRKPLVVLTSGAPGAGKSTLARALGDRMFLPVIDRDLLRQGARRTLELPGLEGVPPGHQLFWATLQAFLELKISVIGDMTLLRSSEPGIRDFFAPEADLVCVHCRTSESVDRFVARCRERGVPSDRIEELLPMVLRQQDELRDPLDLGCPTLCIDTTASIDRHVDDVVAFIEAHRAGTHRVKS